MEFEKIRDIIVEVLNVEESDVKMESTFIDDLGADSLDVFQIIMGLEEEFDIEIPSDEAEKIVTVGDVVTDVRYGTSKPAVEGGKYPYLRMNNLTIDGHLDLTNLKYIDI